MMMTSKKKILLSALFGTFVAVSTAPEKEASAFCGFYVSGADAKLFNNATQVVMMREGTRTVLSMQNNYEGPPENFAMVVPVPIVLQKENVRTLPRDVFEKVDRMTAPRLVEYWEQDPCRGMDYAAESRGPMRRAAPGGGAGIGRADAANLGVTVEAEFDVGEYEIVILSAKDSGGLDTWLKQESYKIPSGAEPFLRPYVQAGSKFFVAKVDPKRITFEKGQAQLSPLRFHYDTQDFSLPVRLGLINSRGTQDLIVNILANERYEPANYPSVTIPTNIDLAEGSKEHFGRFYAALFDRTLEKHPKAVVTEYSWNASTCDPCPGPTLQPADFALLGADALPGAAPATTPHVNIERTKGTASSTALDLVPKRFKSRVDSCWLSAQERKPKTGEVDVKLSWSADGKIKEGSLGIARNETNDRELGDCIKKSFEGAMLPREEGSAVTITYAMTLVPPAQYKPWTITRLHARYSKEALGEDIIFKAAKAIVGGRESRDEKGELEHGSKESSVNNFQGRYAIRHPWIGPVDCKEPKFGVWGGPWRDLKVASTSNAPASAENTAFAPRGGGVTLTNFVRTDVPELGVTAGKGPLPITPAMANSNSTTGTTTSPTDNTPTKPRGCGGGACTSAASHTSTPDVAVSLLAVVSFLVRRRRGQAGPGQA